MEKLYSSKSFLKMAGGRMYAPHPTPPSLYPPLTISYRNHQKSLAYFSHLVPLILFFLLKSRVKKGGAWPNGPPPQIRSWCDELQSPTRKRKMFVK